MQLRQLNTEIEQDNFYLSLSFSPEGPFFLSFIMHLTENELILTLTE
jgi:hypothetical protein